MVIPTVTRISQNQAKKRDLEKQFKDEEEELIRIFEEKLGSLEEKSMPLAENGAKDGGNLPKDAAHVGAKDEESKDSEPPSKKSKAQRRRENKEAREKAEREEYAKTYVNTVDMEKVEKERLIKQVNQYCSLIRNFFWT